ncbi:MAG: TIGR01244 family sulfur transferase [Paracoccaceae bacterium]|nr:TIGR01244 family sulfur transferase [Paracoccaceae bacterium]
MDIRQLTPDFAVSPQIDPTDVPQIAAAGFKTVICNRPDEEVPVELGFETMKIAVEAAGLTFINLPATHQTLSLDMAQHQANLVDDAGGPVLAYCASGTRSSIIWSFGMAGRLSTDEIISATTKAGYQLGQMRPQLDAIAAQ